MNIQGLGSSYNYPASLVTGKVDSAKNPAAVGIDERMKSQIKGEDVGSRNARDGQGALNVADGALKGISDMLTRMKEIAVKASNSAVYTDSDKASMQKEIDQLKSGIYDATKNTEFNTKKLFDGSLADAKLATNPDGSGMSIKLEDTALKTLGIEDFDVTKDFDIKTLDNAIDMVNKSRASVGAQSNALDSIQAYNNNASENMTRASSTLEDLDVEQYVSDRNKKQLLDLYTMYSQRMDAHTQESFINRMFGG